jgi:hypothetical protein
MITLEVVLTMFLSGCNGHTLHIQGESNQWFVGEGNFVVGLKLITKGGGTQKK